MDKSNQCSVLCNVADPHHKSSQRILSGVNRDAKRPHAATKTRGVINTSKRQPPGDTHYSQATVNIKNIMYMDQTRKFLVVSRVQQVHYGHVQKIWQSNLGRTP